MRKIVVFITALTALLSGCAPVTQSTAPGVESADGVTRVEPAQEPAPDAERFAVVPANSRVTVLTFRAGTMARLGHNHAISSSGLTGTVWVAPNLEETIARIVLPVTTLVVDDPAVRAGEGAEFEAPVPEKDRIGTRNNMLGADFLDADNHAFIRVACRDIQMDTEPATAACDITVIGRTVALRMPLSIEQSENQLQVTGEVTLTHEQLGLTPFSAAGGAVRVAEGMTVRYEINAQRLSRAKSPETAD